jgi:hypothetical protein
MLDNSGSQLEELKKLDKKLAGHIIKLNFINRQLIRLIETAMRVDLPSDKYKLEFLEEIDKQLLSGNTESNFWKDKLVKLNSEQ